MKTELELIEELVKLRERVAVLEAKLLTQYQGVPKPFPSYPYSPCVPGLYPWHYQVTC